MKSTDTLRFCVRAWLRLARGRLSVRWTGHRRTVLPVVDRQKLELRAKIVHKHGVDLRESLKISHSCVFLLRGSKNSLIRWIDNNLATEDHSDDVDID